MEIPIKDGENLKFFLTRKIGLISSDVVETLSREAAGKIETKTKSKVIINLQSDKGIVTVISNKESFDKDKQIVSEVFDDLKSQVEPTGDKNKNILEIAGG